MLDIRERTRLRRFLYAKPTILALAFVVVLLCRGVWGVYQKSAEAVARRDKAAMELDNIVAREKELHADIARLSTWEGVEAEIRDRFMVAKAGEKVMIIADPAASAVHTVTVTDSAPSFLGKLMGAAGLGGQ
jgi:cell division protein FtsB